MCHVSTDTLECVSSALFTPSYAPTIAVSNNKICSVRTCSARNAQQIWQDATGSSVGGARAHGAHGRSRDARQSPWGDFYWL